MKKIIVKKILVIDDDELFQRSLKNYLKYKFEVTGAESAEKGLEMMKGNLPDLVLVDLTLPGMDGIAMLKEIKLTWPRLPVIILSALDRIPKVVESIKLGAFDYQTKPIDVRELLQSMEKALKL